MLAGIRSWLGFVTLNNFMNNTEKNVKFAIKNLIDDFKRYPDKYLTESDVRCVLVNELMKIPEFNEIQNTEDNSKSISVHTEVRWYGQSGKLKWRSDIVIIDVSTLKVKSGLFKLPSKGFSFNQPKAIIEIKLRRINGESNNVFMAKIKEDVEKLKKIKSEVDGDYFCCLIVLDKKENINRNQNIFSGRRNLNIYYEDRGDVSIIK